MCLTDSSNNFADCGHNGRGDSRSCHWPLRAQSMQVAAEVLPVYTCVTAVPTAGVVPAATQLLVSSPFLACCSGLVCSGVRDV
jgi:hypothetical protein